MIIDEQVQTAVAELTTLEKFSPYILDSYLSGRDWEKSFKDFYRINCPRFQGFRAARASNTSGGSSNGRGFDIHMQVVHNEFLCSLESLVKIQLKTIDVSLERFVKAVSFGLESADSVPKGLIGQLERFCDFFVFGEMMEDMFSNIFQLEATEVVPDNQTAAESRQKKSATVEPSGAPLPIYTRVLWDIENVGVPKRLGGLKTVQRLLSFLRRHRLAGDGVDCRITAFFNPAGRAVGKAAVQELDKAAVEMVWVSGKREDADRKLGNRVMQEAQVLSPESAAFVVITSDLDFRHHFQLMSAKGFQVVVVHKAKDAEGLWAEALALHAAKAFHWDEVLQDDSVAASVAVTVTSADARPSLPPSAASEDDRKPTPEAAEQEADEEDTFARVESAGARPSSCNQTGLSEWLPAVCTSWNSGRGFGLFSLTAAGSGSDPLRMGEAPGTLVFAHTTAVEWPDLSNRAMQIGVSVELKLQSPQSDSRHAGARTGSGKGRQLRASALRLAAGQSSPDISRTDEEAGPESDGTDPLPEAVGVGDIVTTGRDARRRRRRRGRAS